MDESVILVWRLCSKPATACWKTPFVVRWRKLGYQSLIAILSWCDALKMDDVILAAWFKHKNWYLKGTNSAWPPVSGSTGTIPISWFPLLTSQSVSLALMKTCFVQLFYWKYHQENKKNGYSYSMLDVFTFSDVTSSETCFVSVTGFFFTTTSSLT